ncbi:MAG TPA: tyrosine--tRNA ligase [Candidatus Binatia bacterium]|nr:tyrosine--tRNA ligase [Candidatus Binatia bacterium]
MASIIDDFRARGLIADVTHPEELAAHFAGGRRTVYCGFDPTADSLHVGSLLPLLALRRLQLAGHRPIVLIGGGTGLIGDPSGKAGERALSPAEQVAEWAERLKRQVERFVDFQGPGAALLLDNYAWLGRLEVIPFLRDIGKEFSLGAMLARESVRARLGRPDGGLSYTEFSYQLLQAYDFLVLYREHGCTVQIGGSDQWGNITAGIELIRRLTGGQAYGLTLPLVTRSDGTKFGKTEAGTVWLDAAKTSPYELYQFWLNTPDADVVPYLKAFTFLPLERIAQLAEATAHRPERREAQRALAEEVTALVHGAAAVTEARRISEALFSGEVAALSAEELAQVVRAVPGPREPLSLPGEGALPLVDLLVAAGVAPSRRAGRELVITGAIAVNGMAAKDPNQPVSRATALHGRYVLIRKGKRTYHAVMLA